WTQCEAGDVLGDLRRGECAPACPGDRDRRADHLHRRRGTKTHPRQHGYPLLASVAEVEERGDAGEVKPLAAIAEGCRARCATGLWARSPNCKRSVALRHFFGPGMSCGCPGPQ